MANSNRDESRFDRSSHRRETTLVVNRGKKPWIALLLSIVPGLGHIYLGQTGKGALLLVSIFLWPIAIPFCMVDAYILARRVSSGVQVFSTDFMWTTVRNVWNLTDDRLVNVEIQVIDTETREIDNLNSSDKTTRQLKISREFTYSNTLEREFELKETESLSLQIKEGGGFDRASERTLRERINSVSAKRFSVEETVNIEVSARTKMTVTITWKRRFEKRVLVFQDVSGKRLEIPYEVTVGITFDQEHREL